MTVSATEKELDLEWFDLIMEAQNLGFSIEEIRDFLQQTPKT